MMEHVRPLPEVDGGAPCARGGSKNVQPNEIMEEIEEGTEFKPTVTIICSKRKRGASRSNGSSG